MRTLLMVALALSIFSAAVSQKTRIPAKKYPSLLWEISGNGLSKPSYLFGTMHVSSKMVFHLSDSFYLGLQHADVVALETNMGTWQEDFSKYDLESQASYANLFKWRNGLSSPNDYLTMASLQVPPYEKMIEMALYNNPSIINNFLYRSYSEKSSDFEEDTYLDLHIYQTGKKWGKKVVGVENFDQSMQLMKEAYADASKEKEKKQRNFEFDREFSFSNMEDAYRTGNLDLLDTINKINSMSAAFDEKFLYRRNEIQAASMDSILQSKSTLFVGVGAAHLPGQRGVIEILRKKGYHLRPIKMSERDSRHKDEIERIRVPVPFTRQTSEDGFFTVNMPGRLYNFSGTSGAPVQLQFADMTNGSYYMVTRIPTNSILWGHNEAVVLQKIDSVIYENVPGKILTKYPIERNGYKGYEVLNKTRRGDYQRYNIFVTPFEVILFKMSGNAEYVKEGKEATQFFSSISFKAPKYKWKKWSPHFGGFEAEFPHDPVITHDGNWHYAATDPVTQTGFEIIRTDIDNYDFVEEDSFDLNLMDESFTSSDFIDKQVSRKQGFQQGHSFLDATYQYKDGSVALVRFLIQGTHYYTVVAHAKKDQPNMHAFLHSFELKPLLYEIPIFQTDSNFYYTVRSPVIIERTKKKSMVPENMYRNDGDREDVFLEEHDLFKEKMVACDSTGEKIYISFSKPSRYYFNDAAAASEKDSAHFITDRFKWDYRFRKKYELPNKLKVFEYILGHEGSSRYVKGKFFSKDGVSFRIETEGDTASGESLFVQNFFATFLPTDTINGGDPSLKKTNLFFSDFFSQDTMLHKRAVKNVNSVTFNDADFTQLKQCIQALSWKENKYLTVKKDFLWQLASVTSNTSSDYLKEVYNAAGDTLELQYIALKALLHQKTSYSYKLFKEIMLADPPVLGLDNAEHPNKMANNLIIPFQQAHNNTSDDSGNAFFLDELSDSLSLTASVFRELLPLINIHDYELPLMNLAARLVDSNLIHWNDYSTYLPRFLTEARQEMKKQFIREKNESIEAAQKEEDDDDVSSSDRLDQGNQQLELYTHLLVPFWEKNSSVPTLINHLLESHDLRLKYNTILLLLRNNKPIPDTMIPFFAKKNEYLYSLYTDLRRMNRKILFPEAYFIKSELAKSKLLSVASGNGQPDSVQYIDRLPVAQNGRNGWIYFFRYKQKKEENSWKLATVGMVTNDPKEFELNAEDPQDNQFDFTEITNKKIDSEEALSSQLRTALKKLMYSKRNSASHFYAEEGRDIIDFSRN